MEEKKKGLDNIKKCSMCRSRLAPNWNKLTIKKAAMR